MNSLVQVHSEFAKGSENGERSASPGFVAPSSHTLSGIRTPESIVSTAAQVRSGPSNGFIRPSTFVLVDSPPYPRVGVRPDARRARHRPAALSRFFEGSLGDPRCYTCADRPHGPAPACRHGPSVANRRPAFVRLGITIRNNPTRPSVTSNGYPARRRSIEGRKSSAVALKPLRWRGDMVVNRVWGLIY